MLKSSTSTSDDGRNVSHHRLQTVGLGDHIDVRFAVKQYSQALAHGGVIVGQDDPNGIPAWGSSGSGTGARRKNANILKR